MSTPGHLNSSQRLHLLPSGQYADTLLSEIEATLAASQSKSPFPKFKPDVSPAQAGKEIADAVGIYARVLQAWVRKTFTELQERFDSYADAYRAHLDRLAANKTGVEDEQALRNDLAALAATAPEDAEQENAPGTAA